MALCFRCSVVHSKTEVCGVPAGYGRVFCALHETPCQICFVTFEAADRDDPSSGDKIINFADIGWVHVQCLTEMLRPYSLLICCARGAG